MSIAYDAAPRSQTESTNPAFLRFLTYLSWTSVYFVVKEEQKNIERWLMACKSLFVRIKRWIFNALPEECLHFVCTTGRPSHGINSIGEDCSHYVRTSLTLIFTTVVTQAKAKGKKNYGLKRVRPLMRNMLG